MLAPAALAPTRTRASAVLAALRRAPDRLAAARDGFGQAAASADADVTRVADMVRAAAGAAADSASETRIYEVGLRALAAGASASSGWLAGLAVHLMRAGYRTDHASNRPAIGQAALAALAAHAPNPILRQQAALMGRVAGAAHYYDSSIPAMEAALRRIRLSDSLLGRVAAFIAPQAFSLRALASKMASRAVQGQAVDDVSTMAREALAALAAAADPVGAMAAQAVSAMHFSDTSRDAARAALHVSLFHRPAAPDVEVARAARRMLGVAWAGENRGQWVDEKTGIARVALEHVAASPRGKAFAAAAKAMIDGARFTDSNVRIAEIALDTVERGDFGDRAAARAFAKMTRAAISGQDSSFRYHDDQSQVARHAAEFLATHGESQKTRSWGSLLQAVLAPGQFTSSNVALARIGLGAVARGKAASAPVMAGALRAMVRKAVNGETSSGTFQADRSSVIKAALPWLESHFTDAPAQKLLGLWKAAGTGVTFAVTDEKVADLALKALARGDASDRSLGALATEMTDSAFAGQTSGYAYKDDKTGVALRVAEYLSKNGVESTTREWADFLRHALDRVTFTETAVGAARVAFKRIARGCATDERAIAAAARTMIRKASSTYTSSATFADDRSVVASNAAVWLAARPVTPSAALLLSMTCEAMRSSHWVESCGKVADIGFKAIARGASSRKAIARAAFRMIKSGVISNTQDQGPIAVGIAHSLAHAEIRHDRSRLALDTLAGLMENDADFRERVKVAKLGLERWAASDPQVALDPFAWARDLSAASKNPDARVRMLAGAVEVLARDVGAEDAGRVIAGAQAAPSSPGAYSSLLSYMNALEKRPIEKEKVERMVEAINHDPKVNAPGIEVEDDFVVIGGVRVRKKR